MLRVVVVASEKKKGDSCPLRVLRQGAGNQFQDAVISRARRQARRHWTLCGMSPPDSVNYRKASTLFCAPIRRRDCGREIENRGLDPRQKYLVPCNCKLIQGGVGV